MQPKRGWLAPGAKWLRDPIIRSSVKEILSPTFYGGLNPIMNWTALQGMLDDHVSGKVYNRQPLWDSIVLQIWARKNKIYV
jgi:hypothetical protein